MTAKIVLPEKIKRTIEVEIDPKEWVWITGTDKFISIEQYYNGLEWQPVVAKVERETPHHVAPLYLFAPHVGEVYASTSRKKNRPTLYDGAHEPLSRGARDYLYERRTTDTWVWLDSYFKEDKSGVLIATDHRLVNGKLQPVTRESLEACVMETGLVDLVFNRQGLPTQRSETQTYQRGKNLRYWPPKYNSVAWVGAGRGCADLYCGRDPRYSLPALGVLLCAEGAAKK